MLELNVDGFVSSYHRRGLSVSFPNVLSTKMATDSSLQLPLVQNSKMQNSQGLYNDGLTSACANNGQTAWTYNQIVVSSGMQFRLSYISF